jgi:hypothetical protein
VYSSLHKIDIVVDDDGGPVCVQTDHRDGLEIGAQRDLSVVFAITRILAPRFADPRHERVVYACAGSAPPFLQELVRACGAALTENGATELPPPAGEMDRDAVERLAHDALMSLGRQVLKQRSLEATADAVRTLEQELRDRDDDFDPEKDEIAYYEALVELAAAAGVVMTRLHEGARWRVNTGEHLIAVVPLVIEVGGTLSNVFGRTERFLEREVDEGPSVLLEMDHAAAGEPNGPVVGIIKAAAWIQGYPIDLVCEPLVDGPDLPVIVYAHDQPRSVAYLNPGANSLSLDDARAQAQDFYRRIEVELTQVGDDPPLWVLDGDYYAPEKLLDRELMRRLHARFDAETMLVGVPARGLAVIMPVKESPDQAAGKMRAFLERSQHDVAPADRICTVPFIMTSGEIVGYVPKKKGFLRRLFSN